MVGRLLESRYRLTSLIARGGMATVYRATDERLDRPVAVKVMLRALADDPDFVARFTREARSAARLSASEVVAVYDQGRDELTGVAYLVMEHVQGRDLRAVLRERGALPPARALSLLEPVLRALAAAHRAGIVHRDLKPENVLLGDDGRVKVADFGLARAVETSDLTSTTGLLIGTVAYLAPEQIERGTADARADVYAAGVLLWEMLTGTPPYAAQTPMQVAYRHVHEDVPPPSTVVAGVPGALDDLVVRSTRRDPALRPADAGVFLAELREVQRSLGERTLDLRSPEQARGGRSREVTGDQGRHDTLVVPRPPVDDQPTTLLPTTGVPTTRLSVQVDPDPPLPVDARPGGLPPRGSLAVTPPGRRRSRRGLAIGLVVLLLALLAGGGGWYWSAGRFTRAPAVLALTQAAAEQALTTDGLHARLLPARFDEDVAAGAVLDQDPDPNGRVRKGGSVALVLSKGPDRRTVPGSLVGATQDAATEALAGVGLRVGDVTAEYSSAPEGTVVRTDPAAGAQLRPDTQVALVLSKGVEQLPVTDVRGQQQVPAQTTLKAAGFVTSANLVFSDTVASGVVIDQSPSSGTAGRGSTITLTVSKGPDVTQVPQLSNLTAAAAEAALAAAGLKGRAFDLPDGTGTVVAQQPAQGRTVRRGSTVTYYVF